jgi:hypothetical protein
MMIVWKEYRTRLKGTKNEEALAFMSQHRVMTSYEGVDGPAAFVEVAIAGPRLVAEDED